LNEGPHVERVERLDRDAAPSARVDLRPGDRRAAADDNVQLGRAAAGTESTDAGGEVRDPQTIRAPGRPFLAPRGASRIAAMSALVLIVDDNEDNRCIIRDILRPRGFEVQLARDGASALRSIEERRPDVVLLDVMMPEMDGFELLERLRANRRHATLPVILVTARSQDEDLLAGYQGGADYYITKPFTVRQLLHGVGLVLGAGATG